ARALAPLPKLLPLMARHGKEGTIFLCLKGRQANEEITAARKGWTFGIKKTDSVTSAEGTVLVIDRLTPKA
ncbi:MAG: 16S rRNA (guanine(527)-N(7))-methyltransferase RsmG, partial [Pseudomonadota bacterium]|nr:16S rRNA (guanine(527)-N(7))-methyltransferase RsmG [Pseudomonadota bacterium]